MDFVLMENTLTRSIRVLQPLLELGNLRHMSDEQLRQIARSMSESQATRMSKNEPANAPIRPQSAMGPSQDKHDDAIEDGDSENAVPWPVEPE